MKLPAHINSVEHRATLGRALYAARAERLIAYTRATGRPDPLDDLLDDLLADKRTPREIDLAAEVLRLNALISEFCSVRIGELVVGGLVTAHGQHTKVFRVTDAQTFAGRFVALDAPHGEHVFGITSDDLCHYFGT